MSSIPPYADDLTIGVSLEPAPDITLDAGLAAQYLAISGDQLRAALSDPFSRELTGRRERLANPGLVLAASIGQSTVATGRVIANLRYDNVELARQVHLGETLRTIVTPLGASYTRSGTDRAKVLLNMLVTSDSGDTVAEYQRLALLPVSDPARMVVSDAQEPGAPKPLDDYAHLVPEDWQSPVAARSAPVAGDRWSDPLADTVSSARELVRLTQNRAAAHRDARAGIEGQRLVYGGHTVALAQASVSRGFVDLLTVLAWRSCDHLAPVFEDELLSFEVTVDAVAPRGRFRLVDATVVATAHRGDAPPVPVLEWHPVLLLAGADS